MINNKQVNIWRGSDEPPTKFHIWITESITQINPSLTEWVLKLHDGIEWIPFVHNADLAADLVLVLNDILNLQNALTSLENKVYNYTINSKKIKDNPILNAEDLLSARSGVYINENDNVATALMRLDKLFEIQIIE